jgi:hypothetical protein
LISPLYDSPEQEGAARHPSCSGESVVVDKILTFSVEV